MENLSTNASRPTTTDRRWLRAVTCKFAQFNAVITEGAAVALPSR